MICLCIRPKGQYLFQSFLSALSTLWGCGVRALIWKRELSTLHKTNWWKRYLQTCTIKAWRQPLVSRCPSVRLGRFTKFRGFYCELRRWQKNKQKQGRKKIFIGWQKKTLSCKLWSRRWLLAAYKSVFFLCGYSHNTILY